MNTLHMAICAMCSQKPRETELYIVALNGTTEDVERREFSARAMLGKDQPLDLTKIGRYNHQ